MRYILTALCFGLWTVSPLLAADAPSSDAAVEAKIQEGLKAYKEGKSAQAISLLQDAINAIQTSQQKGLAGFFPKAPEGFNSSKLDSQSIAVNSGEGKGTTATTLTQTFTRESDGTVVTILLANAPEMVKAQKSILESLKNPAILSAMNQEEGSSLKPVEEGGWAGFRTIRKDESAEISAFNGGYMLSVRVNKCDSKLLDQVWKSIDLKGLAKATAGQKSEK